MNLQENINRIKEVMGLLTEQTQDAQCDDNSCRGSYRGPEFVNNSDTAHQFSNFMSNKVGEKLKELYKKNVPSKVDFNGIKMSTQGMGSGNVVYSLTIPFVKVTNICEAYTSFDHVGGWNHTPDLERRKSELSSALLPNEKLNISDLKTTPEGLQEYWIQWKNKTLQSSCVPQNTNVTKNNIDITGNSYDELRNNIRAKTQNISIDPQSFIIDMNNYKISFKQGDKPVKIVSLIWDNISMDNLNNRLIEIKNTKEPTLETIKTGNSNGLYWALFYL